MSRLRTTSYVGDPRVKPPYGSVEVDRGHPLAPLGGYWLFNEGAGAPQDLVGRAHMTRTGNIPWSPSRTGLAMDFPDAGTGTDYLSFTTTGLPTSTATVTMMAMVEADEVSSYFGILETRTGGGFKGLLLSGAAGNPFTFVWDGAASEFDAATGLTVALGQPYIGIATMTADDTRLYLGALGGAMSTFTLVEANTPRDLNGLWLVGHDLANPTGREWDGRISAIGLWPKTLSDSLCRQLHAEPYTFLRPIIRRRYFIPAAVAGAAQNIFIQEHIGRGIGRGVFVGR